MKISHAIKLSLLASTFSAGLAQADMIYGIYAGAQGWQLEPEGTFGNQSTNEDLASYKFDDDTATSFYLALEHPIPLIPNLKVRQNKVEVAGDVTGTFTFGDANFEFSEARATADLSNTDFILYYEVLDNDLISIDFGINGKKVDGEITAKGKDIADSKQEETETFSGVVPMVYAAAEIGLPFSGLAIYGDISAISVDDHSLTDYQVGVAYDIIDNIATDVAVQVGYRSFTLKLEDLDDIDSDLDVAGFYAGLEIHF